MQDNTFGPSRGVVCRLRATPRFLGVAALAVPVVAGVGLAAGLPASAAGQHAAVAPKPADTVRLASSAGESDDAGAPAGSTPAYRPAARKAAAKPATDGRHDGADKGEKKKEKHHGHRGDGLPVVTTEQALGAYFEAGYGYEDAVALADLWHRHGDILDVKVLAGRKLLAGRTLPVAPSYPPATAQDKAIGAFLDAGYDYFDAELLATLYGLNGDVLQAKVTAGDKLLAGGTLPIEHGQTAWTVSDDAARMAYFNNGYGYEDAVFLADLWSMSDPSDAKANAGHKLLDGLPLPLAG